MAPLGLLQRLKEYWPYDRSTETPPPLSTRFAVATSICFTLLYVLPFYFSKATRPSATLSRDSPGVIRARIRTVYFSCGLCTALTIYILSVNARLPYSETFRLLGWYPVSFSAIGKSLALTATLFLGPLFERLFIEENWRFCLTLRPLIDELGSWVGWRNFVAGPLSEELLFRSLLIPINLLSPQVITAGVKGSHAKNVILTTPLFFGLAHIHHIYEFRILHPHVPWSMAIAQAVMQLGYTTLFGWFAAFVFVRTGSIWAVIIAHSFCNWMGLPRLWGKVERPQRAIARPIATGPPKFEPAREKKLDSSRRTSYVRTRQSDGSLKSSRIDPTTIWTLSYYILLLIGLFGFYEGLWPLTSSAGQLANI